MNNEKNKMDVGKKDNLSFLEKIKSDKKYKAKVEFIGYGIFIVVLVVYLNIASLSGSRIYSNNVSNNNDSLSNENLGQDDVSLENNNDPFEKIVNNYEYDVNVSLKLKNEEDVVQDIGIRYYGKLYLENLEINKETIVGVDTYYKVDDLYYSMVDDKYQLIEKEIIYDVIGVEYIEYQGLKEYIEKSSLDHVTNYSSGKREYVYHLKIKDIIRTVSNDEEIEFSVVLENDVLMVEVDYSKLVQYFSKDISECKVIYNYQNIGKVEEFEVLVGNDVNNNMSSN